MGLRSGFVLMLGLAAACAGKSERIPDEGEAGSQTAAGTGGTPGVGGNSTGAGGSIPPGTGGLPEPGTGAAPDPGTGGTPEPATGGTPDPGTGGTSDPGTGGIPDPGAGGTPDAGTGATGNVGGSVAVGGSGSCGPPPVDPSCRGISTGSACETVGLRCESMSCGLADVGRRTCECSGIWSCTPCDFTGTVYAERPDSFTECTGVEQDAVFCPVLGALCLGASTGEACACYVDDECDYVWDCDKLPPGWDGAGF